MSTYEQLKGLKVKYLSADTSGDRLVEGELFYNSTNLSGSGLKSHIAVGAWSAGANVLVGRYNSGIGGTQTASFLAGGANSPDDAITDETYEYNGVGWTTGGTMAGTDRLTTGSGTLTAGLIAGGWTGTANNADSEEYNGTAWTEGNNLNTARRYSGHFGIQTAAVICAGETGVVAATEEYNGTSWSNGNDVNTPNSHIGGAGTLTAGLKCGGSPTSAATEEYDGTDWTSVNNMNTARRADSLFGLQTAAILAGGYTTTQVVNTEEYNGTTWTEIADISAASYYGSGMGTSSAGLYCQGLPANTRTEEWNVTTSTITGAAWAAGGNMNTARNLAAGAGTQNAAWIAGGNNPGTTYGVIHEQYNGTAWTEAADLNTPRNRLRGAGSQAAALAFGGFDPGGSSNASEEWNGSSWAEGNNLNTGRRTPGNFGTQTAAVACGGTNPGASPTAHVGTEEYNGTSWSNTNALNAVSPGGSGSGTQTAGLNAMNPGGVSEDYDGSSWATGPSMMIARNAGGSSIEGTQTATQFFAGSPSPTASEQFNGTTFISDASLANGRSSNCGGGTSALSLCFGDNANAEEYTPETTAVNAAKTIDFD